MKLLFNYLSMHLKTCIEYKSSFIMVLISQVLYMLIELFAIYALFTKFQLLDVYDINKLLLGFSTIWLGYSITEIFGRGFDQFSKIIVNGEFDLLLIRPRNIFLQILGTNIAYEKSGRALVALGLFIYSSIKLIKNFTLLKILLLFNMIIGCIIVIMSLFIIGASICFLTVQGLEVINIFTNGTKQVSEYPIGIYNKIVKFFFTFIIPITLINYYPIDYLIGDTNNILYVFIPLIPIILLILSTFIFKLGMRKYCSTGS